MPADTGLIIDDQKIPRCWWCGDDPLYVQYHDEEWGLPVLDNNRLFEKICLEGFQAGLSWLTILRKRENFRAAFRGFDIPAVARFTKRDVTRLLKDPGIIRHRGKIESAINNACRAQEVIDQHGSLAAFFWRFEPHPKSRPTTLDKATLCANPTTAESIALGKELKRRGWTFVGPTTVYAFMQAVGLVNDHVTGCKSRSKVDRARRDLRNRIHSLAKRSTSV